MSERQDKNEDSPQKKNTGKLEEVEKDLIYAFETFRIEVPPKKKPYTKPHLIIYGNIKDMTKSTHMGTMSDHHHGMGGHKTA
jgi:hypothetical protein